MSKIKGIHRDFKPKIDSASTHAELEKIRAELKPTVRAVFVEKDLLLVRARFGKQMQWLKAGERVVLSWEGFVYCTKPHVQKPTVGEMSNWRSKVSHKLRSG